VKITQNQQGPSIANAIKRASDRAQKSVFPLSHHTISKFSSAKLIFSSMNLIY